MGRRSGFLFTWCLTPTLGGMGLKTLRVALLGFGTVGKGVYQTIQTHQHQLQKVIGRQVQVSTIVVKNPAKHRDFTGEAEITTNFQLVVNNPEIDVVFEAIPGKEPAFKYLTQSIQTGKQIITANKEMFAHYGGTLKELAKKHQVKVGFEATTAGGIPVIQTIRQLLQVNQIKRVTGILNGTSNYILTEMRKKKLSFSEALAKAQQLGYAEADPANDIEGKDAFYKLMILSELIFSKQPEWQNVKCQGIQQITRDEIQAYQKENKRIKHIAMVEVIENKIEAKVEPLVISEGHPFYHIEGAENAISIETDIVGQITLTGPGAGMYPTASAMIEDFCILMTAHKEKEQRLAFT